MTVRGLLFASLATTGLAGCGISTTRTAGAGPILDEATHEAEAARRLYGNPDATIADVREAYRRIAAAARGTAASDTAGFDRWVDASRYAIRLSRELDDEESRAFADSALVFANSAVMSDTARVEGFYYRAIAAGLIGGLDHLRGRSAMSRIRTDGRRAVALDPAFEEGGPHRLLGALYLRAPGPPRGVGSLRRAVEHLEEARRLGPGRVENLLYLAEAYLEDGRAAAASELIERAERIRGARTTGERRGTVEWIAELRTKIAG